MPRKAKGLTAVGVRHAKPGRHAVGNGLYLAVRKPSGGGTGLGSKSWIFRYTFAGRIREAGLGSAAGPGCVTLADAIAQTAELRKLVRAGIDPLDHRQAAAAAAKAAEQDKRIRGVTFRQVAEQYIAAHEPSWSRIHATQWRQTLRDYVFPAFGEIAVAGVAVAHVLAVIEPLWNVHAETASRVRGRVETVLHYAAAKGLREKGFNPATWKGNIQHAVPARRKLARVQHFPALDWRQLPALMAKLREQPDDIAALALQFVILTAARTGEAVDARLGEINGDVWSIPGERMKVGKMHNVPLSRAAMSVLEQASALRRQRGPDAYVFQSISTGRQIGRGAMALVLRRLGYRETVHGMRASFRSWAADHAFPREVVEKALAHSLSSEVERAYNRADLMDQRRRLAESWSEFLSRPFVIGEVVAIRQQRT
jgi:integrase